MTAVIGRIVRDEDVAADVLQEMFAEIWRRLRKIDRHPNPHAYILRMCVSRSYDALRRQARLRRHSRLPDDLPEERDLEPSAELSEAVREAVAMLPAKQAAAVTLRAMDSLSYGEIGETLGCAEATARSHYSKGKARVRKILAARGILKEE